MSKAKRTGTFKFILGTLWLKLNGWTFEGEFPKQGKCVLLCAPHTSNLDFIYLLSIMFILRMKVSWIGKHTLFKKPFGGFMKWLGGIPVDRGKAHGVVDQIASKFKENENLIIAITPAGTRKKTEFWKSGFYHIALKAQVPLLLGYADYANKKAGTGPLLTPSGDISADMDIIRSFYSDIRGAQPENESRILLREEIREKTDKSPGNYH